MAKSIVYVTKCLDCPYYYDGGGSGQACSRHICNCCGECTGTLYSFGEVDFDLCVTCYKLLCTELAKGLTKIEQKKLQNRGY